LCRTGSERWSKSRKPAACIIATNASPPDSQPLFANGSMRGGTHRFYALRIDGFFDLDQRGPFWNRYDSSLHFSLPFR
jgi:hypothetical protein